MPYSILLVDDDKDFCKELVEVFDDYSVVVRHNGLDAVQLLKDINIIDLVILDIKLPDLKGTLVLKEIKNIKPNLYTIMLTGYSSEDVVIEALKAHADDYLQKPFDISRLKKIVDNLINFNKYQNDLEHDDITAKIDKVKLYIERNFHKVFNLNDISKIVYLSPKYLSKLFRERTGKCFNTYKLEIKISYAKDLLNNTGYNIDQIAYKLGYKNSESFIKIFRKLTKLTPTEFRKKSI